MCSTDLASPVPPVTALFTCPTCSRDLVNISCGWSWWSWFWWPENEFGGYLSFQAFFRLVPANMSLNTNNSFSGGEIYCSTCYTREFGPGGRSKFGEKTEVQDEIIHNYNSHINNFNHFLSFLTIFQAQAVGGDKGACLRWQNLLSNICPGLLFWIDSLFTSTLSVHMEFLFLTQRDHHRHVQAGTVLSTDHQSSNNDHAHPLHRARRCGTKVFLMDMVRGKAGLYHKQCLACATCK